MVRSLRFAIISDPHIALPHTIVHTPHRFHLVEVSIPAMEQILRSLETQPLDFLLLPGDLTQHGERENHEWLVHRLKQLPFPAFVVPGNHDIITRDGDEHRIGLTDFPQIYGDLGYVRDRPYYHQELLPGMHLIGLNSIAFDETGQQLFSGFVDAEQLDWLSATLERLRGDWVMVTIHHNVLEHLPGQSRHPMGRRYITQNRDELIRRLRQGNVNLLLTGHLHVQDIAQEGNLWEVTTGSLVSYPHPYRLLTLTPQPLGQWQLAVESQRVQAVPDWPDLQITSRQWMRDRSQQFMMRFLMSPPFNLPPEKAKFYAPDLQDFWADISNGDSRFDYPHFPAEMQPLLQAFGAIDEAGNYQPIDNHAILELGQS
ncbi:metallophosphoesterase family protein [Leptolyngbya iicbica]|uniref:Metallophosphoesterase n=2 Tax=Cyanophyceae TaxID=3028117 RepID=A0A4Q7E9T2_9CYAN|nr:metallophosphoesterase [Leptolyngbya sp. LK]RZM79338.1 metallophosphoesterase [Leptolyngbya sp. LK]